MRVIWYEWSRHRFQLSCNCFVMSVIFECAVGCEAGGRWGAAQLISNVTPATTSNRRISPLSLASSVVCHALISTVLFKSKSEMPLRRLPADQSRLSILKRSGAGPCRILDLRIGSKSGLILDASEGYSECRFGVNQAWCRRRSDRPGR